ncbi:flippase [Clostridium perfringens]|nr:flippase [Clostridium perfringens]
MKEKIRSRYLLKNTIIFAIGSFGTKMISFFLVPLYTNILTIQEYGTVDLFNTICMVLVPILTLNISDSVMRFALDKNSNKEEIMSIGLLCLGISVILGYLIFPFINLINIDADFAIYIYIYTVTQGFSQVFLMYLRGKEKLLEYSIGSIIQSFTIALFNIIFLIVLKKGIKGYFTAYILSNIITACYAFICGNVKEVFIKFEIKWGLAKQMVKYSIVLIPNTFMWWIMNSSDRIMVTAMLGAAANGIYAIAYKIPTLLNTITGIFNQAWSYSAISEADCEDIDEYSNKVYNNLVSIVVLVATLLLIMMKPFLKIYVDKSYYIAWMYTPFLIIAFVFMTLGSFLATSYTVSKDSKGFLYSGIVGAIINLVLNWILIPKIGVFGAAIATCISYISVYLYRSLDIQKYNRINIFEKKHIIGYLLLVIISITMFYDSKVQMILYTLELLGVIYLYKDNYICFLKKIKNKSNS